MNSFVAIGTLTKDAELRYAKGTGTPILNFTIAVNRSFKKEDGADFINCTIFGALAEKLIEFYVKGLRVSIQGELRIDNTKDEQGNYKSYVKVLVNRTQALSNKKASNTEFEEEPVVGEEMPW